MTRVALYARFSSEKQNDRSASDQLDLCRAWAERQGYVVVEEYRDEAISGASRINRLGLGRLMRDARDRRFDIVVCEALDRLSRDQADLATIRKELNFVEIGISTVQDGEVGALHIGVKGLLGELYLADLAQKTRRGLRARVTAGGTGGGISYGYRAVEGKPGELVIDEQQAVVVRRIFAEYVAGRSPRAICFDLNQEGTPGPRGGPWRASTLNGSRVRQNGLLQNRLYVGEIVWNRQRFIKDPATAKRVSRPNPQREWVKVPAPHLAIVESDVFEKAVTSKARHGEHLNPAEARKPRHLLSGLVKCGCCGASFIVVYDDRLGCASTKETGTCDNRGTIPRAEIEERVLTALATKLAAPELIAAFVKEYQAERRRLAAATRSQRDDQVAKLATLKRGIARLVDAIVDGTATKATTERLQAMEAEAEKLEAELATSADDSVVTLHPGTAEKYRRMVADLQSHVAGMKRGQPAEHVIEQVRGLIARIEVGRITTNPASRKAKSPAPVTVYGALARLLLASKGDPRSLGNVGCGDRI